MNRTIKGLLPDVTNRHGLSKHPLYRVWLNMHDRCYNPDHKYYSYYGGRGIFVCDEWFELNNFIADMNPKPSGGTLDRINNDKPYTRNNCHWTTQAKQIKNRSNSQSYNIDGITKSLLDWSLDSRCEVSYNTLHHRVKQGWDIRNAVFKPLRKKKQ